MVIDSNFYYKFQAFERLKSRSKRFSDGTRKELILKVFRTCGIAKNAISPIHCLDIGNLDSIQARLALLQAKDKDR